MAVATAAVSGGDRPVVADAHQLHESKTNSARELLAAARRSFNDLRARARVQTSSSMTHKKVCAYKQTRRLNFVARFCRCFPTVGDRLPPTVCFDNKHSSIFAVVVVVVVLVIVAVVVGLQISAATECAAATRRKKREQNHGAALRAGGERLAFGDASGVDFGLSPSVFADADDPSARRLVLHMSTARLPTRPPARARLLKFSCTREARALINAANAAFLSGTRTFAAAAAAAASATTTSVEPLAVDLICACQTMFF